MWLQQNKALMYNNIDVSRYSARLTPNEGALLLKILPLARPYIDLVQQSVNEKKFRLQEYGYLKTSNQLDASVLNAHLKDMISEIRQAYTLTLSTISLSAMVPLPAPQFSPEALSVLTLGESLIEKEAKELILHGSYNAVLTLLGSTPMTATEKSALGSLTFKLLVLLQNDQSIENILEGLPPTNLEAFGITNELLNDYRLLLEYRAKLSRIQSFLKSHKISLGLLNELEQSFKGSEWTRKDTHVDPYPVETPITVAKSLQRNLKARYNPAMRLATWTQFYIGKILFGAALALTTMLLASLAITYLGILELSVPVTYWTCAGLAAYYGYKLPNYFYTIKQPKIDNQILNTDNDGSANAINGSSKTFTPLNQNSPYDLTLKAKTNVSSDIHEAPWDLSQASCPTLTFLS